MRGAEVVGLAFGVMKATDLAKEVFTRTTGQGIHPYVKSVFATGLSVAAGVAYERTWRDRALLSCAVAGASAVLHEGYGVLASASDRNRVAAVGMARSAARGGPGRRVSPLG